MADLTKASDLTEPGCIQNLLAVWLQARNADWAEKQILEFGTQVSGTGSMLAW